jgi:hypothetical protein
MFSSSSGRPAGGGQFAYLDANPIGPFLNQYNSSGAVNTVTAGGVGVYTVRLPGLGLPPGGRAGSLQATAVNAGIPARCKVGDWAHAGPDVLVRVLCFNAAGAPLNTRFTLSYQQQRALFGGLLPPREFGYLWFAPPTGPAPTNFNSIVGAGANTATPSGPGLTYVTFPRLFGPPDNVQVTASGFGSEFCGMMFRWVGSAAAGTVVRNVNCWTNAGTPVNTGFLISFTTAV